MNSHSLFRCFRRFYSVQNSHPVYLIVGGRNGIGKGFVEQINSHYKEQDKPVNIISTSRHFSKPGSNNIVSNENNRMVQQVHLDVNTPSTVQDVAEYIQESFGRLDYAVSCIGILHGNVNGKEYMPEKELNQIDFDWAIENFKQNTFSAVTLAKYLTPVLSSGSRDDERAVLAFLSARIGSIEDNKIGGWYSYRMSKAALNQFIKTLGIELKRTTQQNRKRSTIAIGLHPGTVDTKLSKPFQKNVPKDKLFSPSYSTDSLLNNVLYKVTTNDSGKIFAYDGKTIPY